MPLVKADLGQCQGYGNCVAAADDTFDLDDDAVVALLRAGPRARWPARSR
jgi:ferredoxin